MSAPSIRPGLKAQGLYAGSVAATVAVRLHLQKVLEENPGLRVFRIPFTARGEILAEAKRTDLGILSDDSLAENEEWLAGFTDGVHATLNDFVVSPEDYGDLAGLKLPATTVDIIVDGEKGDYSVRALEAEHRRNLWAKRLYTDTSKVRCDGVREFLLRNARWIIRRNQRREEAVRKLVIEIDPKQAEGQD